MQKNIAKQLLNKSPEIAVGGLTAALGFLAGDPVIAGLLGAAGPALGAAGPAVVGILKKIGHEFSERRLSHREDFRVGNVVVIAAREIYQRLENGENPRNDGFFDTKSIGRSDAEEIVEAVMLKCQREPQEKKIPYMGYLLTSIAFDSNISADMGHQLIKAAEELTYRQLCILKLAVVKNRFSLRNQDYRGHGGFSKGLYSVLYECMALYQQEYIILLEEGHALGLTSVVPQQYSYSRNWSRPFQPHETFRYPRSGRNSNCGGFEVIPITTSTKRRNFPYTHKI